jgi:hypothetical protein
MLWDIRIRGKVGRIEEPEEYAGLWAAEMTFWDADASEQIAEPMVLGPFDAAEQAKEALDAMAEEACKIIQEAKGQEPTGEYVDFRNGGIKRRWGDAH